MPQREAEILPFAREEIERSLPQRFAKVVAARSSFLAIAAGEDRLTYAELSRRADALAAEILRRQGDSAAPVAMLVRDPVAIVTAIFATWQAGKLCVPIDAALPPGRVESILRHSQSEILITDRSPAFSPTDEARVGPRELRIDPLAPFEGGGQALARISGDSPACVLYTSGSTGEPKGVLRTHRSILHRARGSIASLGVRPQDRLSILHSPASPAGIRDVLAALLGGAALFIFDLRDAGFSELSRWIIREEISVLCGVVSTWRHVFANIDASVRFSSLRMVRLGSEPIYRRDVERLREHVRSDCILVTGYGATEASGVVEYRMDGATPLPPGRIPAGYLLEDVEIDVRDEDGRSVRPGDTGEVVVRCPYLASGYWRQPELTRSVFESDSADGRICAYRTGDIGRMRPDGCLELLGRRDDQVKVRGYRVNPGEIELALVEHPSIREAVVTSSTDADDEIRLTAYVVPQSSPVPTGNLLRRHLARRLPAYMLPSAFVTLDTMPLTATGKVDRRGLPPVSASAPVRDHPFIAPRSPTEHQVAAIWERIFGVSPIGANDNFFDLGGDSLLAAAMVSAIEETCDRVLSPSMLLQASTVADMATAISREEGTLGEPLTALRASGKRTPIFFLHNDSGRGLYTHALARSLDVDRPFYAVHRGGSDAMASSPTVEALAADRIRALRAARPHGPYVLGGHCHGGLIALEMARQLRADGEQVDLVVMVDTCAPSPRLYALRRVVNVLIRLRSRMDYGLKGRFQLAARAAREIGWRARYYQKRLGKLAGAGIDAQVDFARRKLARSGRSVSESRADRGTWRFYAAPPAPMDPRRADRRAVSRYVPPRYAGPVALFRAEHFAAARPDLGWSALLPRLQVVVVPGDHHSCITRHVATFGAHLDEVLRRAEPTS